MNFLKVLSPELNKGLYQACRYLENKTLVLRRQYTGPGSGAGKGGGAGGSVKESGGGLGRYAAAQEEGFFYNKQQEQIKKLKQKLKSDESAKRQPKQKK